LKHLQALGKEGDGGGREERGTDGEEGFAEERETQKEGFFIV